MWPDLYRTFGRVTGTTAQGGWWKCPTVLVSRSECGAYPTYTASTLPNFPTAAVVPSPSYPINFSLSSCVPVHVSVVSARPQSCSSSVPTLHQSLRLSSLPLLRRREPPLEIISVPQTRPLAQRQCLLSAPSYVVPAIARFSSSLVRPEDSTTPGPGARHNTQQPSTTTSRSPINLDVSNPSPSPSNLSPSQSQSEPQPVARAEPASSQTVHSGAAGAVRPVDPESGHFRIPSTTMPTTAGVAAGALRARVALLDSWVRLGTSLWAAAVDLGAKLNQVTGYDNIEQMKRKVDEAAQLLAKMREQLRTSKVAYETQASEQGTLQRQQMDLLQRKSSWQAADLERFTELCRQEHRLDMLVAQAKTAYADAAEAVESCHDRVAEAVRERYSAETLWSDKIRRASTWWTAGLMALNLVSFMSVYLIMEPIKARRLRNHVEEVLQRELALVRGSLASLEADVKYAAERSPSAIRLSSAVGPDAVGDDAPQSVSAEGAHLQQEILEHVRHIQLHLAMLERGYTGVAVGNSQRTGHVVQDPGISTLTRTSLDEGTGKIVNTDTEGEAAAAPPWYRRFGRLIYSVITTREVTTAAAALLGSGLGVGIIVLLRDS